MFGKKSPYRIHSYVDDKGNRVDVVEGEIKLDTKSWSASVKLPPFIERPDVTLIPYGVFSLKPGPTPEIASLTSEKLDLTITTSRSAHKWTWRARGKLLKPVAASVSTSVRVPPTKDEKWSRGEIWGAIGAIATIATLVVAIIALPSILEWLHPSHASSSDAQTVARESSQGHGNSSIPTPSTPANLPINSVDQRPTLSTHPDVMEISSTEADLAARQARVAADDIQACLSNTVTVQGYCVQQNLSKISSVRDYLHDRKIHFDSLDQIVGQLESEPSDTRLRKAAVVLRQVADRMEDVAKAKQQN